MDPTDPVPDYIVELSLRAVATGAVCVAVIKPTGPHDVHLALDDLHRHTRAEVTTYAWAHGYQVRALRWDDVEMVRDRPIIISATADLEPRDDELWMSIRQAILEDEHDRRTMQMQADIEEQMAVPQWERRLRRRRRT